MPKAKPASLHPLTFDQAVQSLIVPSLTVLSVWLSSDEFRVARDSECIRGYLCFHVGMYRAWL